jgi:hypothetical protein
MSIDPIASNVKYVPTLLISNLRLVPNDVFSLLGDFPASEFCVDVSEHPISSIFIGGVSKKKCICTTATTTNTNTTTTIMSYYYYYYYYYYYCYYY